MKLRFDVGRDVVDVELTPANVYAAYEEAVLEYSYIVNLHQSKNVLSDTLGATTGTFNYNGELNTGPTGSNLSFVRNQFTYAKKVGGGLASMLGDGFSRSYVSLAREEERLAAENSPDPDEVNDWERARYLEFS